MSFQSRRSCLLQLAKNGGRLITAEGNQRRGAGSGENAGQLSEDPVALFQFANFITQRKRMNRQQQRCKTLPVYTS